MVYLAMTAAELQYTASPPEHTAWMACHFSPYGTGLTNIPASLPPDSLLILNDRTPVSGHDPQRVSDTLQEAVDRLQCSGILLDFQHLDCPQTASIAAKIAELPCSVGICAPYARDLECAVFLPPVPLLETPEAYLSQWHGREIWLEAALDCAQITLTEAGTSMTALPSHADPCCSFAEEELCCHYSIAVSNTEAVFTLQRRKDDLTKLLSNAKKLGVTKFVGLYQELGM